MRFGRQPLISETAVQAVLDTLVFSSSHKSDAITLQYLFLVEEQLLDPKIPRSEEQRLYTIQLTLIEIISSQLKSLRTRFQGELDTNESHQDAIQSLLSDSQIQSNELISWSILYYLYVQIDLGLTVDSIATVIGVAPRTLRRYRTYGIKLLTQKLWTLETDCRRNHHYRHIKSQLDPWNVETFVGREHEIHHVVNNIIDDQSKIIYIHGEKGIGKTTFIRHAIAQLIDHMPIDDLLWISRVDGNEIAKFRHYFVANNPDISLNSIFRTFKCVIVLDNADDLLRSSTFENLLDVLQGAIIFFSSRFHYPLRSSIIHVPLSRLATDTTESYIETMLDDETTYETIQNIRDLSDGNPHKINYLINYHKYSLPSQSYTTLINGLQLEQRLLLLVVPSQDGMLIDDVKKMSDILGINHSDINFLLDLKFLNQSNQRIYGQVESNIIIDTLPEISVHIIKFADRISSLDEPWILPTHILSTYNKYLDNDVILLLIHKFWRSGLLNGNKVVWHSILLDAPQTDLWLSLAKAVSYKEMNELHLAESLLLELLHLSGLKGEFNLQAEASLELVKVYRLRAYYKQALYHFNTLDKSLKTHFKAEQYTIFILEQAQLALDMDQLDYAITLVTPLEFAESFMIQAEALYRLDKYQSCLEICNNLLIRFALSDLARGIIHNLIGRCYQNINYELATDEFDLAIEYLSKTFNLRHLSHAQINLATAFIQLEEIEEAMDLLNHAEELCQITNDRIGMTIIKKNKTYIHRIITSKY